MRASPIARFVAIVVFPAPPFGHIVRMTRVASSGASSASNTERLALGRVEDAFKGGAELVRRHVGRDHVSGAGVERGLQEIRRRLGHDHRADVGPVVVDRASEQECRVGRDARPERHDLGSAVSELLDQASRIVGEHAVTPVAQLTLDLALERSTNSLLEIGVSRRQHELVHVVSLP